VADVLRPDAAGLRTAVRILRSGGLVGLPTETVYGLAGDALDPGAVGRIFEVKGRPADNPLIVHLGSSAQLDLVVARPTPLADALAARFWPGPLTVVLDAAADVPAITTGGLDTVAVRVPDHPVAAALLAAFGGPLAAPSANRSGRPSSTTAQHVVAEFGDDLEVVLDGGPCPVGLESTVVDARGTEPVVLREGSITREDLEMALLGRSAGTVAGDEAPDGATASPGTRYRHYTPSCAVELVPAGSGPQRAAVLARAGGRVGLVGAGAPPEGVIDVARFEDASELAQKLYAALRDAELADVEVLVVESVPEVGVGRAVMDRLRRASA
jgi:L-threonylcarbamoyladenylate synthase